MSSGKSGNTNWHPVSITLAGTMLTAIVGTVVPLVHALRWWVPGTAGVIFSGFTFIPGMVLVNNRSTTIWRVAHIMICLSGAGVLATLVAKDGWSSTYAMTLIIGAVVLFILSYGIPTAPDDAAPVDDGTDRRPQQVQNWEALLRAILGKPVTVESVKPWAEREDGERIAVLLPPDGSITVARIADPKVRDSIATARHLPHGCDVQIVDGEHQAQVFIDVMLRNTLAVEEVLTADVRPMSVNDEIKAMNGARGENIGICLRRDSLVVGGSTDSGKTTFLDGLIMRLDQMVDNLTWTLDLNGGGLAETHLRGFAFGKAPRSPLDWVAGDAYEALAMMCGLVEIAHFRKTSSESVRRKRAARTKELPVDKDYPQITVVADEMAEMKKRGKGATVLSLLDERIEQTIQIGRAEACRVIQSVLRGTTDVTTRGSKVQSSLRICLRMNEDAEYSHVLGVDPGNMRLTLFGQGWVLRRQDARPILARTLRADVDVVEESAIRCIPLRPKLDKDGRAVLANMRLLDIFPEALIDEVWEHAPQLAEDIEHGRLYSGRWDRAAEMIARIRGDEPEEKPAPPTRGRAETAAPAGSPADRLLKLLGQSRTPVAPAGGSPEQAATPKQAPRLKVSDADVTAAFEAMMDPEKWGVSAPDPTPRPRTSLVKAGEPTARERLLTALREAYPDGLTPEQLAALPGITKQRRKQVLDLLEEKNVIRFDDSRWFFIQP